MARDSGIDSVELIVPSPRVFVGVIQLCPERRLAGDNMRSAIEIESRERCRTRLAAENVCIHAIDIVTRLHRWPTTCNLPSAKSGRESPSIQNGSVFRGSRPIRVGSNASSPIGREPIERDQTRFVQTMMLIAQDRQSARVGRDVVPAV